MFWTAFLLLMLHVTTYNSKYTQSYSVIPSLPPKAFVGEYYTCDFRVQGLINPVYTFKNLPSFLKSTQNGRVEGIPNKKGTYKINMSYGQNRKIGQTQIILSVSNPQAVIVTQNTQKKQTQTKINNITTSTASAYAEFPSVYTVGDDIFLNLPQLFAFPTKVWTYEQLPSELTGTDKGYVSGSFYMEGMYSFAAIHSDQNGKTKNFIITLNIQPTYYYDYWGGYDLEDVPVKDSCKCFQKAMDTRKLALSLLAQAQEIVNTFQQKVNDLKVFQAKQALLVTMTQSTLKTQTEVKQLTLTKQGELIKKEQSAKNYLSKGKSNYDLASINYNNSQCNLQKLVQKLKQAEQNFNKSKTALQAVNKIFIEAQSASSSTASEIGVLQVKIAGYKDDVQGLFNVVASAKQTLFNYQNYFTNNSFVCSSAQNAKEIANMENDIALADYRSKQTISNKTQSTLKRANQNVTDLRDDLRDATNQLGAAKFNLNQTMNQLLVAQAAKAASDKNLAIVSIQLTKIPQQGTSKYVFGGCDKGLYLSFSGTVPVKDILSYGAILATGHTLLYGNCSKAVPLAKGDMVVVDGYLKDGIVHGISVSK